MVERKQMSVRQVKALIAWAKSQQVLTIKIDGVEVTFHPSSLVPAKDNTPFKRSREDLLKEEDELLYASAI